MLYLVDKYILYGGEDLMDDVKDLLFKSRFSDDKLHSNYKRVLDEELPYIRDVLKNWAEGFIDRDKKFINEFQTTFNSSFWELYLFAVMKELKLEVNLTHDRPDFVVEGKNGFTIEATIASHANHETPEWEKKYSQEEIEEWTREKIINNATLRLANAFMSKSSKYTSSYNKLNHVQDKPYVIAIAPFDSPYFFMQSHHPIQRVLYGFDRYIAIDWDEQNREILDEVLIEEIEKTSGAKVPLGYFTTPKYSHVSAVIFSNVATFSKVRMLSDDPRITLVQYRRYNDHGTQPIEGVEEKSNYHEHLLDGLVVFHNPYADIPFNIEEFYHPIIGHYGYDLEKKEFISDIPHGMLFQRLVQVIDVQGASLQDLEKIRRELTNGEKETTQSSFPKYHI